MPFQDQTVVEKVGAFILRQSRRGFNELLLFRHADLSGVPVQIPGGTIEIGQESVEEALHREVLEESGLVSLKLLRKIGISEWWPQAEVWVRRHVFLLEAPADTADEWIHTVSGTGSDAQLRFAYYWCRPSKEFRLGGGFDIFLTSEYLPELYADPFYAGLVEPPPVPYR